MRTLRGAAPVEALHAVGEALEGLTRPLVVVGVDGRHSGLVAAQEAAQEAKRRGGSVLGVHVRVPLQGMIPVEGFTGAVPEFDEAHLEFEAAAAREQLYRVCSCFGVEGRLVVVDGDVTSSLEEVAREVSAAVLVVGARHRRTLSLHSCPARRLVGRCSTPVHVVEHE